jgi:hypothetical protein
VDEYDVRISFGVVFTQFHRRFRAGYRNIIDGLLWNPGPRLHI